jgi:hypothetical protein
MNRCQISTDYDVVVSASHAIDKCINGMRYVELPNNSVYSLILINLGGLRADVEVAIDGEHIGTWRVSAYDRVTVYHPADSNRELVFVSAHSEAARKSHSRVSHDS